MPAMVTTTMTTTTDSATTRRFAVACGVLSQYVKAAAPAPSTATATATALMGAVVQERTTPPPATDGAQQLTIFYGGRVVVLDGCTPARAAELIRYAAAASAAAQVQGAAAAPEPAPALVDMPIARKASLQRFLAKRKDRAAAIANGPHYGCAEAEAPPPVKKVKAGDSSWLALGSLGDMHAQ